MREMYKLTTVILTVLLGVRFNEGRVSAMLWSILSENKNERLVFNAVHALTTCGQDLISSFHKLQH